MSEGIDGLSFANPGCNKITQGLSLGLGVCRIFPALAKLSFFYFTENLYSVEVLYVSPGFNSVDGN
jgi:hypothetical protein